MNKQGRGFITIACNTQDINYLEHAYLLAESIKDTQKENNISLIANASAVSILEEKHRKIFDNITTVMLDDDPRKNYAVENRVWNASPYKQTIKIESDFIIPHSIDHWWDILDQRDIVLTTNALTYWGDKISNRSQRKLFDENDLPDVYNAVYYFRYSQQSANFFKLITAIFQHWDWFKDFYLKNCRYEYPVTDEVFAIAAKIFGIEKCTLANSTVPSFVHMKNALQNLPTDSPWWEYVYFEKDQNSFSIGHYKQTVPFHYQNKKFLEIVNDRC